MPDTKPRAFTLIELLIVIAIVGLLSTIAVAATNSARIKARDSKRLSDLKQIQKALELSYEPGSGFPMVAADIMLGDATHKVFCNVAGTPVFQTSMTAPGACGTVYMGLVPANPTPGGAAYAYESTNGAGVVCTSGLCNGYCIQTTLEQGNTQGGLAAGAVFVDSSSIKNGTCP